MIILYLALIFMAWRYSPILKSKADAIYQEKFNISLFSKQNSKRLLYSTFFIFTGNWNIQSSKSNDIFVGHFPTTGYISLLIGFIILLYIIFETYKKTDLYYGSIAAILYLFILGLQYLLGWVIFMFFFVAIIAMSLGNNNDNNNNTNYWNNDSF